MKLATTILLVVLTVLLALPAPLLLAGETVLSNAIRVSDEIWGDLSTPEFDVDPAKMTDEEFAAWAKKRNAKELADAKVRHQQYLAERGPLKTVQRQSTSFDKNIHVGGGYGAGGVGGTGGYLGTDQNLDGLSGGNTFTGPHAGSSIGNNITITGGGFSSAWVDTYPDLNDAGGGPVTFINPYCRTHWVKRTKQYRFGCEDEPKEFRPVPPSP